MESASVFILLERISEINSPKNNYAPMHFYFRCLGRGIPRCRVESSSRGGSPNALQLATTYSILLGMVESRSVNS